MFLYAQWLNTPLHTRQKVAKQFGITKKHATEVVNNTVKNDGYLIGDIEEALTISALQNYLETEEREHMILWNMLMDKVEGKTIAVPAPVAENAAAEPSASLAAARKRGRPAKSR